MNGSLFKGVVFMFFKKLKNNTLIFLLTLFIIPQSIFAYSDKIIASGETVGIKLNTEGILIVGSYDINGHNSLVEAGLNVQIYIHPLLREKLMT